MKKTLSLLIGLVVLALCALLVVRIQFTADRVAYAKILQIYNTMTVEDVDAIMREFPCSVRETPRLRREDWAVGHYHGVTVLYERDSEGRFRVSFVTRSEAFGDVETDAMEPVDP
jgi:hypothetical protein